jgi:pilus assembly protein Flp/PilA
MQQAGRSTCHWFQLRVSACFTHFDTSQLRAKLLKERSRFPGQRTAPSAPGINKEDAMRSLLKKISRFLAREDGPTAVEYAVMLSLIVLVCLTAITTIGSKASNVFSKVANSI